MASEDSKKGMNETAKKILLGVVGVFVALFIIGMVFGTPSADAVFKDMNDKMLQTKSVTIDQKLAMKGTAEITTKMYMDFNSSTSLSASGSFGIDITDVSSPMTITGDLIKIGDSDYAKFNQLSSTDNAIDKTLSTTESQLKNNWIKVRANDQYATFTKTPIELLGSILPVPYANLNGTQRKDVLVVLQDKSMYTISESSKVDVSGVSAYKYLLTYNKDQFKKAAKLIAGYASYFKIDDNSASDELTGLTVWVNINTKQIIKIEYSGTTSTGDITGSLVFTDYNKIQTVEKPSEYFIESELLN